MPDQLTWEDDWYDMTTTAEIDSAEVIEPIEETKPVQTYNVPLDVVCEIGLDLPDYEPDPNWPEVPFAPGVNVAALTAGDENPLFVTRPLAILNAVSNNSLKYDQPLFDSIYHQVVSKKPAARRGHVPDGHEGWEFPPDVGLWVGALPWRGTLLGKCYILPDTGFDTMVRKREAAGTGLSNSVWGKGRYSANADGTLSCVLNLETIDFAPEERASLQPLGGKFEITSEMGVSEMSDLEESVLKQHLGEMDLDDLCALFPEDKLGEMVKHHMSDKSHGAIMEMIPEEQRKNVAAECMKQMAPDEVFEMLTPEHRTHVMTRHASEIGQKFSTGEPVHEMTEFKEQIAEMQNELKTLRREKFVGTLEKAVADAINPNVTTDKGKEAVEKLRKNFKVQVVAQMAGSTEITEIEPAVTKAWEDFKPIAELTYANLSGPNSIVGETGSSRRAEADRYEPAVAKRSRANLNL
jgi:hypothetical protein